MPIFFVDIRQDLVYAPVWQSRPVRPILKFKRSPKQAYFSFRRFSCAIGNHFFGDPDSDVKNAKLIYGPPSRPCLCIRLALTARPTHFKGKTSPEVSIPLFRRFLCAIANHFLGDPDSDVKNTNFYYGCLSRPYLCILLTLTSCPTYFEGQTSPEASIPLISMIFVCYSKPFFG